MHYTTKIDEQTVDTSTDKDPIEFHVGEGQVLPGIDEAVVGLEKGEKKTVTIPPEKAYGQRREGLTTKIPKSQFKVPPESFQEGTAVQLLTEGGRPQFAFIAKIETDDVILDLNHPLAGITLKFEIEIVDIKS